MFSQVVGRVKTGTKAATGLQFDAFDLLRADHMKLEALAVELRLSRDKDRRSDLLTEITDRIKRHMKIEEEIVYPTCARVKELEHLVDSSYPDHQIAKNALKDLAVMNPETGRFSSLVTTLIRELELHVHKEEDLLFPGARAYMDHDELSLMNERVIEAFKEPLPQRHSREKRGETEAPPAVRSAGKNVRPKDPRPLVIAREPFGILMKCNVGATERILRFWAGAFAGYFAIKARSRLSAIGLGALAFYGIGTASTRYCPVNQMMGINRCQPAYRSLLHLARRL